jgi:hypothetical protein
LSFETIIQLFVAVVLFFTLLAATFYAWVTNKLWKESVKQTRFIMRPIVVITYDEGDRCFKYINYGNTPAFSIKIDDVTLINTEGLRFDYVFPEEHILPQSREIRIENIKKKINDVVYETSTFELGALTPFSANRTFDVTIRYKNSENEEFITEGKVGQETFNFKRIKKIS